MKSIAFARVSPQPSLRILFSLLLLALAGLLLSAAARAQTASFSYAVTALGGGFDDPFGVAVDVSGNVYAANYLGNTVVEMPAGCASSSCVTTLGAGFINPAGVAVDGSGNVYVANSDDGLVDEMSANCSSSSCVTSLGGGFYEALGVAVDGSGNVFVADTYNNAVKKMPAGCASSSCVTALGGGFSGPSGVTVDRAGNIYVADTFHNAVKEMPAGCASSSCVTTLGGGFSDPFDVAVDAGGNIYVADDGNNAVKEMPAGCATSSCVTALGDSFAGPQGVAVDGSGNVYVADSRNNAVKEIMTRAVNFFTVPVGTASAALTLTFTIDSAGSLSSTTPYRVLTEGAKNLDFNAAATQGSNACKGTPAYTTGETCTVNVTFTPAKAGPRYGAVQLLNASGSAIATAYVYGTGQGPEVVFSPATQSALGGGFSGPGGTAVDSSGNVYVADYGNNAVEEMPAGCASPSCLTPLGGGFSGPEGVAVDGSGNVYVADYGNSAVKEMPAGCGTSSCVTALGSGFNHPERLAVDGSGNVYVADYLNSAVKQMPAGCASSSCVTKLGGGFSYPTGVAVDGSGHVYVTEFENSVAKEMPAGCASSSCVTTLGGGFSYPEGVAVDASGNVYVADSNNNVVKEMPAGCATSSCVTVLAGGSFGTPQGVAVDGSGNVYVADSANNAVEELNRVIPPSLTFPDAVVGSSGGDFPQTVQVVNIGNQPLTFSTPESGTNPSYPANFPENAVENNLCASGTPLAQGTSCNVSMSFAPTVAGANTGSVVLTDNALNQTNATQSIALSGVGTGVPAALTSPTPSSTLGSTATFTWTAGHGVTKYEFLLGTTGPGSDNLDYLASATALSSGMVSNIPTNGKTLYARLYSLINGVWQHTDYTYTESGTPVPAALTSPAPGSTLTGSSATFGWTAGGGVTKYEFLLGTTGPGSDNLDYLASATALSSGLVSNIPTNGKTLYARLYSLIGGIWQYTDYTYTESGTAVPAALTSPAPGSTLAGSSATFSWTAGGEVTKYEFLLGTTGPGSDNLDYLASATALSSGLVSNIPTNGKMLYARLYSLINGGWQYTDYTYTESGTPVPAVLTSPAPGSTLTGSTATFGWTAGNGVTKYEFLLGTTGPGSDNLDYLASATALSSGLVSNIPTSGAKVYARLYSLINGVWQYTDYTYTEQ